MLLLEIADVRRLIQQIGLKNFFIKLCENLTEDFSAWEDFQKSARHAVYVENGVIELMPVGGKKHYSFKYVNGHPLNPTRNKLTVVAVGMLSDVDSGYPLMISEMTLLTAIRTAAISALASKHLARKNSKTLAIIGCGAQSEFQVLAHDALFDLKEVRYFDLDEKAMQRFADNLKGSHFALVPGSSAKEMIQGADIIITATAAPGKNKILEYSWLTPGQHISGVGGDSPDKTELDPEILQHSKIAIEYFPQTFHEGEIQNLGDQAKDKVYAELWEIFSGKKPGRVNDQELTLFDDVGFALEDFSVLRLVYDLAAQHAIGKRVNLVPNDIQDVKNLFSLLNA
ncbi:MAG: Ornithine cyclodeaminase [Gammaproteobacteria bacterium]|jgi:ornithine cyclodeaminase|nr:Ornithine cyclodeaminase [Gammaproteobacteria bacterium]